MPKLFVAILSLFVGFTFVVDLWRWACRSRRKRLVNGAINRIEQSRRSHIAWAEARRPRPPEVGPPSFHRACIRRYDFVLGVLRGCREEKRDG